MLAEALRAEQVQFVRKDDSRLMRVLSWLLVLVGNRRFLSHQWTTLGGTIYVPASVDPATYGVLVDQVYAKATAGGDLVDRFAPVLTHELQHVRDMRRFHLWFVLSYLLLPFPFLLAYGRVYWEARAYALNIRHHGRDLAAVAQVLWSGYGWPLPRPWIRAVLRSQVRKLENTTT